MQFAPSPQCTEKLNLPHLGIIPGSSASGSQSLVRKQTLAAPWWSHVPTAICPPGRSRQVLWDGNPRLLLAVLGHPELFLRGQAPSSSSHILRLGIWSVPGKTEQGTRCPMKIQCFPAYSDKLLQVGIAETKANCSLQLSAYS